ncbi:MAG TPA: hypothetical protein VK463_09610 [Desulfomonilaceae bacterium]|nr:hypothetical protein [Desulfomonilaceae bacterium]
MAAILVDKLIATPGAAPEEGYDPVSQAGYSQWRVGDEARFSVIVSEDYRKGSDYFLSLRESSPSASAKHGWQVATSLLRCGLHATNEQTAYQTFSCEFSADTTPNQLTSRKFAVTGSVSPGIVAGLPVQAQDILSFRLTRVSASVDEDPEPIRIFGIALEVYTDSTRRSACAGRVGKIIDAVRDLFNESTAGFLSDDFILRGINRCQQDLAQEDYWRTESCIPCVAGSYRVNLMTAIPNYQRLHQVYFNGQCFPMTPLGSFSEFEELRTGANVSGQPECYVVQNDSLFVWPTASADLASGFCVYHSYLPDDLTCSDVNPNPPLPRAHDILFVYYVLREAFLRDRHAPGADVKFQEYSVLYEREKQKLLGEATQTNLKVRSYR